ncbi:DUF3139 domain-containing protein [Terribacillus sp. DMT04]|uniref:DUF3139 domain-containing protein n=1 Tax=Terribacillus sp. DMT04 TaxID=2850441 RepID=UPI001C2CAE47|nr:DUF3139 domain-containing protein [Terribacillus sp. DMT04]QXE02836.1 DUF3139 domain-containing protein [Terribacillus sp. DMT04]
MKRYRWWVSGTGVILLLLISTPFVILYLMNNGNPYTRFWTEKQVPAHLAEQGYTEDDYLEAYWVLPNYRINKDIYTDGFVVRFKDEPNVVYTYGVKRHGKEVVQYCEKEIGEAESDDALQIVKSMDEPSAKHSESTCIDSMGNR